MVRTYLTTSVDTERDADILQWASEQENLSASIRAAIRQAIAGGVTLADVHQELLALADALTEAGGAGG